MRVLVAMQDEAQLELLQCYLWDHGMEVEVAADARECLATMRAFAPDALVLDLDLPWDGSRAVMEAMDDDPDFCEIPVVIVANSRVDLDSVTKRHVVSRLQRPFRLIDAEGHIRYAVWRARSTRKTPDWREPLNAREVTTNPVH